MIPEQEYSEFKWITVQGFNDEEWEKFKTELTPFNKLYNIDGIDEEDRSVCFKFNIYIPKNPSQIKSCKYLNQKFKTKFIQALSKNISGRMYFNAKHGIIKKLK